MGRLPQACSCSVYWSLHSCGSLLYRGLPDQAFWIGPQLGTGGRRGAFKVSLCVRYSLPHLLCAARPSMWVHWSLVRSAHSTCWSGPLTLSLKERHCCFQIVLCVLSVPSIWTLACSFFLRTCPAPSMTSPRERKQLWAQQSVRPAPQAARGIRATRLSLLSPHTHPPISPASLGGHHLLLLALLWEATNLGLVRFPLQVFQVLSSLIICCPRPRSICHPLPPPGVKPGLASAASLTLCLPSHSVSILYDTDMIDYTIAI